MPGRLAAIDWLRGSVMLLMAIDHGAMLLTSERLAMDSAYLVGTESHFVPGTPLPADRFFTRWITHLCAPTFLFLTGTSLALSVAGRERRGDSAWRIDRHLLIRGLVLIGFEVTYLSLGATGGRGVVLQVLYAIGLAIILMVPLRRLPTFWLVGLAAAWLLAGEWITGELAAPPEGFPLALALLIAPGQQGALLVLYPVIPWLALLALGWGFGRSLLRPDPSPAVLCALGGGLGLLVFAITRAANAYGNMFVLRDDASLVHWLHASKYPPSLSFAGLELGLMALLLAGLFVLERRVATPSERNPLLVFGQTALFFYLVHFALLAALGLATGTLESGPLAMAYVGAAGVSLVLYPACLRYRAFKRAHPTSFAQFV